MKNRMLHVCLAGLSLGLMSSASAIAQDEEHENAAYVMTNSAEKNQVISFVPAEDGSLQEPRHFDTGGRGSGGTTDPLESQGALTFSQDHAWLFAVNAGSGELSVFRVHGADLELTDRESIDGSEPVSVAQSGNLVYVANAGGTSNVVGFRLRNGHLQEVANSTRFLSTTASEPGSVAFSPNGKWLAVVERATNTIDIFAVQADGTLSQRVSTPSAGQGAFAGQFAANGALLVSETGPSGVPNGSAISSYALQPDGTLKVISASVPTLGAANCWNAITPDGRFAYTGNSASSNISGFVIGNNGTLTALAGTVVGNNPAGAANIDMNISADGRFLFTLNTGDGTVGVFAIQKDGTLLRVEEAPGLTAKAGFQGIAAN